MKHYRIIYYLFIVSFLFGTFQLYPLYAQEQDDSITTQTEIQLLPEDFSKGNVSTENVTGKADIEGQDAAAVDPEEAEVTELEVERIMRRIETRKERVKKAKLLNYAVLNRFPHRPQIFTQGLIVEGDTVIESGGGYGKSSLSKVNLQSGEVLAEQTVSPHIFAEGVASLKGLLYQLSFKRGILMVYHAEALQIIRQHQYKGEGWGLTSNNKHLIMSDGSDTLKYMDPTNFKEVKRLSVTENGRPLKYLNELEWVGGKIYANVWLRNKIVIINPKNGVVTAYLDLKELLAEVRSTAKSGVLNGIAYDKESKRLYVTGKYWPTLFEIKIES